MFRNEVGVGRVAAAWNDKKRVLVGGVAVVLLLLLAACSQKMRDMPKLNADEPTNLFANGTSSQVPPGDTVAQGYLRDDVELFTGKDAKGTDVTQFPFPIAKQDMLRGQERYNIYCAPCHGELGDGNGVVAQRGFNQPPPTSYHQDRLRNAPVGYLYQVITNGLPPMPSYANQISPRDRWLIVAYIRALQYSQNVNVKDLPQPDQQAVTAAGG
jgi:mono/diheme cytochrome c family protein